MVSIAALFANIINRPEGYDSGGEPMKGQFESSPTVADFSVT